MVAAAGCCWSTAKGSVNATCKAAWMSLWLQVCASWHMRRRHQEAPPPSEASKGMLLLLLLLLLLLMLLG